MLSPKRHRVFPWSAGHTSPKVAQYVVSLIPNESILLAQMLLGFLVGFLVLYFFPHFVTKSVICLQGNYGKHAGWLLVPEWCCLCPHHEWMDPRWEVHSQLSKLTEFKAFLALCQRFLCGRCGMIFETEKGLSLLCTWDWKKQGLPRVNTRVKKGFICCGHDEPLLYWFEKLCSHSGQNWV